MFFIVFVDYLYVTITQNLRLQLRKNSYTTQKNQENEIKVSLRNLKYYNFKNLKKEKNDHINRIKQLKSIDICLLLDEIRISKMTLSYC